MIPPKIWGYVGIALALLALIGAVVWQMNVAVQRGVELGEAQGTIKDLRAKLKEQRDNEAAKWAQLHIQLMECSDRVTAAVRAGDAAYEAYQEIKLRPPEKVVVEIESTTWHESLIEGHGRLLSELERIRNESR